MRLLPIALGLLAAEDGQYASLKADLRRWAKDDPIDALAATVVGGGIAFYLAERDTNPGCATPWDAILYVATCLSVYDCRHHHECTHRREVWRALHSFRNILHIAPQRIRRVVII